MLDERMGMAIPERETLRCKGTLGMLFRLREIMLIQPGNGNLFSGGITIMLSENEPFQTDPGKLISHNYGLRG